MKITELKILNWVVYPAWYEDGSDRFFMIREMYFDENEVGLTDGIIQTSTDFDIIQPIPLTEEWLMKLGFFKYNNAWVLKEPTGNMLDFGFSVWEDMTYNTAELKPPLDYVHQLQNLYFALTGEELRTNHR